MLDFRILQVLKKPGVVKMLDIRLLSAILILNSLRAPFGKAERTCSSEKTSETKKSSEPKGPNLTIISLNSVIIAMFKLFKIA